MPRVHFVKKARKAYKTEGIKKGDSYFYWSIKRQRGGVLRRSKTQPRPSQLTESAFYQPLYSAQEAFEDAVNAAESFDDLYNALEDYKSELQQLADEQDEKFSNMPEGLQQGDTGQLLEERREACEDFISELEGVDMPDDSDFTLDDENEQKDYATQLQEKKDDLLSMEINL